MKLKPIKIRVIAKKQPHDKNIRIEAKLDHGVGRKVFSFTLYETTLSEVMRTLVSAFERKTKDTFPEKIKSELGIVVKDE